MSASSAWGPFMAGIEPAERWARLRGLRVAVHVWCGSRGRDVEAALARAADAFERLATLARRRVLATYGATL